MNERVLCVRKVPFGFVQAGYGPIPIEDELRERGRIATWCGRSVVPTDELPVFVGLDAATQGRSMEEDEQGSLRLRRPCPDCFAAAFHAARRLAHPNEKSP